MLGIFRFKNIFRVKGARGVLWVKVYNWKNGNLFIFSLLSNGNSFFFISFIIYTILNPFCLFGHSRAFYELTLLFFFGSLSSFPSARVNKINNSWLFLLSNNVFNNVVVNPWLLHSPPLTLSTQKNKGGVKEQQNVFFCREKFI